MKHFLDIQIRDDARSKAYSQGSAAVFIRICDLLHLDYSEIDLTKRAAKRNLYEKVLENVGYCQLSCQSFPLIEVFVQIENDPECFQALESLVPGHDVSESSRPVLGKDIMEQVWLDMRSTQLPSWITPAPRNWGTTQRGKLTANNWRVICTIHLPITLIRLWGRSTERKRSILRHFMDLVAAIRIANLRITSVTQIQAYDFFIKQYIAGICRLYPDQKLKPTHHSALHITDMLGLFGPNHSHNGAHYERYINFFHRVNTNSKIGTYF